MNQGDYQLIRANDSQTIEPSEFGNEVQPKMTFEMSIVMWQEMADQKKCPRCHFMNLLLSTIQIGDGLSGRFGVDFSKFQFH